MYMDAELPEKTTADVIGRMDVCTDPEGNPQAELILKLFGTEPYQTFCQGDDDEIEPNTTKQELAAEKPKQEKEQASASKTKSNVASTALGKKGSSRSASMTQEKTPSHPGGGMCRAQ